MQIFTTVGLTVNKVIIKHMNQCLAVINMMQILCLFCLQDMYAILALNYIIDVLLIFMVYYVLYHKPQKCCYSNWYGHKSGPMFQLGLTTRELLSCIISGTSR